MKRLLFLLGVCLLSSSYASNHSIDNRDIAPTAPFHKKSYTNEELYPLDFAIKRKEGEQIGFKEGKQIGFEEGKQIGFEKGRLEVKREVLPRLFALNIDNQIIAQATGLSISEIEAFRADQNLRYSNL